MTPDSPTPIPPDGENPYDDDGYPDADGYVTWGEGYAAGFAAGRAAASPDLPTPVQPIPGPDSGACPSCGCWRKAGMIHRCEPDELDATGTLITTPVLTSPDPPDESHAVKCAEARGYARGRFERDPVPASPDERLREAARAAEKALDTAQGEAYLGSLQGGDPFGACELVIQECVKALRELRPALAAADREAPDGGGAS